MMLHALESVYGRENYGQHSLGRVQNYNNLTQWSWINAEGTYLRTEYGRKLSQVSGRWHLVSSDPDAYSCPSISFRKHSKMNYIWD